MNNFIAFHFSDNDFHNCLRMALNHIIENRCEELTLENYKTIAVKAMVAFDSIDHISNWYLDMDTSYDYERYTKYCNDTLKVSFIKSIDELDNFEGYIIDNNRLTVFYHGYWQLAIT